MGVINSGCQESTCLVDQKSVYFRIVNTCFQLIPILFLAGRLIHIWTQTPPNLTAQFDDDAFYYLKVAQNIVHSHHPSFDQITTTNGWHPLWLGLLLPFTYFIDDRVQLLRFVASFSTVLLAIAYYLTIKFLVRNYHIVTAAFVVCGTLYWIVKEYAYGHMESSILLPLCVACISRLPSMILEPNRRSAILVGVLFAMTFLARLDAVFLIMCLLLVTLIAIFYRKEVSKSEFVKLALIMTVPSFVVGTIYIGANYFVFGHPVPVSGYVKSLNSLMAGSFNWVLLAQLWTRDWLPFSCITIFTVAYLITMLLARSSRVFLATRTPGLFAISIGVSLFNVFLPLYYLFCSSWAMWFWYQYPAFLSTVFVIPLVLDGLLLYVLRTVRRQIVYSGLRIAVTAMALFALMYGGKDLVKPNRDRSDSFQYNNYLLAQEMNKEFPDKNLVAMGDRAGSFAYWYDGNVLQIEGVIGDYKLVDAIQRNDLANFLTRHGVQLLVHWSYQYPDTPSEPSGRVHNLLRKLWSPTIDFAPAENYVHWDLVTPWPFLSMGPYARLRVYKKDEALKFRYNNGFIYVWKWPGSEPQQEGDRR